MLPIQVDSVSLLERHLPLLEGIIGRLASQRRLSPEERGEFYSYAMLRLLRDNCRILQQFSGRCRWSTYLSVVVQRLFLDYRDHVWGKWRPSTFTFRLGKFATELERLICRDRIVPVNAVEIIHSRFPERSREELESLASRLPRRGRLRSIGNVGLDQLHAPQRSDRRLLDQQEAEMAQAVHKSLHRALQELDAEDRTLLDLRFNGLTIPSISRKLGCCSRSLYRRLYRCLGRLRKALEAQGIDSHMASQYHRWNDALARVEHRGTRSDCRDHRTRRPGACGTRRNPQPSERRRGFSEEPRRDHS